MHVSDEIVFYFLFKESLVAFLHFAISSSESSVSSRLRLSHEVEHSKSRQEERSSELQAMCRLSCTWHAGLIALGMSVAI